MRQLIKVMDRKNVHLRRDLSLMMLVSHYMVNECHYFTINL
jgi:hypothetical protein